MSYIYNIKSFADLRNNLEWSDQLLLQHQIQLMQNNVEKAQGLFEELYTYRKHHLNLVESLLLPLYQRLLKEEYPQGGKPLYFIRERTRILADLEQFVRQIGNCVLESKLPDLVVLFEDYAALKDLLDHHDAREKAFLLPTLDSKLDIMGKEDLFKEIARGLQP